MMKGEPRTEMDAPLSSYPNSMSKNDNTLEAILSRYNEHELILKETIKKIELIQKANMHMYYSFVSDKYSKLRMTAALLYRKTLFKGEPVPFVMELPNYRLPSVKSTAQLLWEKAKDFLERAFTVIFIATIVIWFLQSFSPQLHFVEDSSQSILALISGLLEPLMRPLGLGDWRICTSLISGVMAKESVVSTLEILFSSDVSSALTSLSAASLLVFSLLSSPCIAAIASVKRELGRKWAVGMVVWQCVIAWLCAFLVHLIASIF